MRPPKGMFWREGRGYYCRVYQGGKERWVALGKEFDVALAKFKETRFQPDRDERVLVHDLIERWLKVYIATARNEKGQQLAKRRTELYFDPFFGPYAVGSVRPQDLRRYRLHLEKRVGTQTTAHILSDARCFFLWAKDCEYIRSAPVPKRLLPRVQERPPDRLTDDEVRAVLGFRSRGRSTFGWRWWVACFRTRRRRPVRSRPSFRDTAASSAFTFTRPGTRLRPGGWREAAALPPCSRSSATRRSS